MARIAESEIDRIKKEIDLAALIRSRGIELKPHGSKDLVGLSPFTEEKTPSFIVTPSKNLWHCMSSGQGGSVIDFIIKHDGVSFRHAVELLRNGQASKLVNGHGPVGKATVPKLESPVSTDADDQTLLGQTIDYYQERLRQTPAALDYLKSRGLNDPEAIKTFRIGFADRTLGLRLPHKNRKDGLEIRERLTRLGIYRDTGHEHFNGCVVFPIFDEQGNITEVYGRKIVQKQRTGIYHLYLPGPHVGIFNAGCLQAPDIILCESVIDALTFWGNGQRNVTCIYGTEGFTDELFEAFRTHKTQRIYLAYDNDKAGNRASERDATRLSSIGIDVYRIKFPAEMDANEYALKVTPAAKSLAVLVQSAQWLSKVTSTNTSSLAANTVSGSVTDNEQLEEAATKGKNNSDIIREDPRPSVAEPELKQSGEDYTIELGERSYRIRGLQKNTSFEVLKINLRIFCQERFYLDTLDLYRAKDRQHFIQCAADETQLKPELIKRDLGKILLLLEELQEKRLKEELEPKPQEVAIPDDERQAALELLKSPNLLERILADFDQCGIVGESTNKLTGYIAAVSRKLDKPLAIIIQSSSAAGKTSLMEAVLEMMPQEERIKYSAMTGQSLYYLGETNLKHKILAIVEEEGAEKASYALKLLQSEGELTIASTGKDDNGRMKTEEYHVEGPVMIFLTTTAIDIDEELLNRCLVLTVDESREQTGAIHDLQREAETVQGLKRKLTRKRILEIHRNAQRLLKTVHVVNPFAPRLTFNALHTRSRRDHMKYLTLIRTIALLHQYQRPIKKEGDIEYIEVELSDIEAANRIAGDVLARSLDELPPQTRRLLRLLQEMVKERCQTKSMEQNDIRFTRRHVREFTGWSLTQTKVHLDRLEELEYITIWRGSIGKTFEYELLMDMNANGNTAPIGLLDVETLLKDGPADPERQIRLRKQPVGANG